MNERLMNRTSRGSGVSGEQTTSDRSRPMGRNERHDDDERGGVSTIARVSAVTRPGVRPRPAAAPGPQPERRPRPAGRAAPNAQAAPSARPAPAPAATPPGGKPAVRRAGTHRLPFVLLLCGLLGGALICALVISTTLAEGAFEISNLQNSTTAQAKQLQSLEEEVAQAQSAQQIATRAAKLGMVGVGELRFLDLKTGKTATDADPHFAGNVPGYYP
jgi:hypothetical protein